MRVICRTLLWSLTALTGETFARPLTFQPIRDDTQPEAKVLREHFIFLVEKISAAALPKLVSAEFEQTLQVMSLYANRHSYSHLLGRPSPDVALRQIQRAEEYIEANWRRSVTLEELAQVTGVSALSPFRSYKKCRGISPTDFMSRVRLRRARQLLESPGVDTTVAGVAAACGFYDLAHFVDDYLPTFGEQPADTLRRSQGTPPVLC